MPPSRLADLRARRSPGELPPGRDRAGFWKALICSDGTGASNRTPGPTAEYSSSAADRQQRRPGSVRVDGQPVKQSYDISLLLEREATLERETSS